LDHRELIIALFKEQAEERSQAIKSVIENNLLILRSVAAFYYASENIDRHEFGKFTKNYIESFGSVQALEWIPRVSNSERARFEQTVRDAGFPGFEFTESSTEGEMTRAADRDEYFPVYYMEPLTGNERALGFDLASNPAHLEALEKSRDTSLVLATVKITLVQEKEKQPGFLVFHSI
jgi:CHASE1-domain containing sensor protein